MMHVRLPPLPESRWARAAQWLACAAVPIALGAVLATRAGQIGPLWGIALIAAAAVLASTALSVGVVAAIDIWRHGARGLGPLFRAFVVACAVLGYPAWLATKALRLPALNDITTDLDDPPVFSSSPGALAARDGHRPADLDRRRRQAQEWAYPAIRTIVLDSEPETAFQQVRDAVKILKWRVIEEVRPDDRRGLGRIEAIVESPLMRFQDDITIRFRWTGSVTRVDLRSVSRFGRHDFGANAARIRRFQEEIVNPSE